MIEHLKRRFFSYKEDIQMSKLPDTEDVMEKINELVDAVNKLEQTVNNSALEDELQVKANKYIVSKAKQQQEEYSEEGIGKMLGDEQCQKFPALVHAIPFKLGMEDGFKVTLESIEKGARGMRKSRRPYITTPHEKVFVEEGIHMIMIEEDKRYVTTIEKFDSEYKKIKESGITYGEFKKIFY